MMTRNQEEQVIPAGTHEAPANFLSASTTALLHSLIQSPNVHEVGRKGELETSASKRMIAMKRVIPGVAARAPRNVTTTAS